MDQRIGLLLRGWRNARKLSLGALARLSGVGKSTLSDWENGRSAPSIRELENVLSSLSVSAAQRKQALQVLNAPRAIATLAAEGHRPPVAGDLLRAMRLRKGMTQAELARSAGVTQGMIAKWERSEDWPSEARLHAVCYTLGARSEELCALLRGRFAPHHGMGHPFDLDTAWAVYRPTVRTAPLYNLSMFSMMTAVWPEAQHSADAYRFLTFLYASHSRYLLDAGRTAEAEALVDRTLARVDDGWTSQEYWVDAYMTRIVLLGKRGNQYAKNQIELISESVPHVANRAFQGWMYSEMGAALARIGHAGEAIKSGLRGVELAAETPAPEIERFFRTIAHLNVLVTLRDVKQLQAFMMSPLQQVMRGRMREHPDQYSGQIALIRAYDVMGDRAETENERAWLETHVKKHGIVDRYPGWDEGLQKLA